MHKTTRITEKIYDAHNCFSHVNVGDEVDGMWGYSELTISLDDIAHLLKGGVLYMSDGEYAKSIALKRE